MFRNGRKTIGVFISDMHREFQREACRGIAERAKELGMNVAFFASFGAYYQEAYGRGEINIAALANIKKLDGIIFSPGTYVVDGGEFKLLNRIREEADCPIVTMNDDLKEFGCVQIDNQHVIEEVIEHFVTEHGFKRICYISGPKGVDVAEARLDSYRRVMKKYGIYDESHVYYGDFWRIKSEEALEELLEREKELPEAIVCANDSTALTICMKLQEKGIRVPEDIAVSGCDDIEDAVNFSPSLTTVRISNYSMGSESVNMLMRLMLGLEGPRVAYCSHQSIYRESCGCKKVEHSALVSGRYELYQKMQETEELDRQAMFLSVEMQCAEDLTQLFDSVYGHLKSHKIAENICLCFSTDWRERGQAEDIYGFSESMSMELGMKKGERLTPRSFFRETLLPEELTTEEPMAYVFFSMHYRTKCYGYMAVSFYDGFADTSNRQLLLINICNAIEGYRIREELHTMYIHDVLTGLMNRRGFVVKGEKLYKKAKKEGKNLFAFSADLDDLKGINDTYGHACGDKAIALVADALAAASISGEICARVGGDEFSVLGIDYTEERAEQFANRFTAHMELLNKERREDFRAYASWGYELMDPADCTLEELLNASDKKLYIMKKLHGNKRSINGIE